MKKILILAILIPGALLVRAEDTASPVINPETLGYTREAYDSVGNEFSFEMLYSYLAEDGDKLFLRLPQKVKTLSGREISAADVYGTVYFGPYPFETAETTYDYAVFRKRSRITGGTAEINVKSLFALRSNSENWSDTAKLALRLELHARTTQEDIDLGTYQIQACVKVENSTLEILPSIIEGPFVTNVTSDNPTVIEIVFRLNKEAAAKVVIPAIGEFMQGKSSDEYKIRLVRLKPDTGYKYYVEVAGVRTGEYEFKTAPLPGKGKTRFVFACDSRGGYGGGDRNYMGVNYNVMERIAGLAWIQDVDFMLHGGDLVNGYTTSTDDFRSQIRAFKQSVSSFWRSRPVYTGLGNHEALVETYRDPSPDADKRKNRYGVQIDKRPYATDSAEAVFAGEFYNPLDAPPPPRENLPTLNENTYSFQYGPVKVITICNNYWYANYASETGGAPEGWLFPIQLGWLRSRLQEAEEDPTVKYVIVYAQEPVFPNGGHVSDTMWYRGDNNVRAHMLDGKGELRPAHNGIIEVRNDLAEILQGYSKVAAFLAGDEHAYHRIVIDKETPVGDPKKDDFNRDGKICGEAENEADREPCSPLAELKFPLWYITSGGAGAPYYSEEPSPWNEYLKKKYADESELRKYYFFTSQLNYLLFEADENGISVTVYNPYGEKIDSVQNLMDVKKQEK